jgi:hypothetical protein
MQYTNIRYSITLNDEQYAYLTDEAQGIPRIKCFRDFLRMAVMEETEVSGRGFSAVLHPGQFMASKVELGQMWKCDRKTATRIVQEFNQMDIIKSHPSNRTTIHSLQCLSVWFTSEGTVKCRYFKINPYVRPIEKSSRKKPCVPPDDGAEPTAGG